MNKADKRQRNIRNKLMAAIAMLLVASIMTVSTTYAWFTLSTAPEVQGITTTIGANGNLEIALADPTGDNSKITSAVGDGNMASWLTKNLTWGNLLDLSDESYGLGKITLLPSRLNITAATETTSATLSGSPLSIPVYGTDGRITHLDANKMQYGVQVPAELGNTTEGFLVNPSIIDAATQSTKVYPGYGVRALGTSSTMSATELAFTTALNAITSNRGTANNLASGALYTYGDALAEMALLHANEDDANPVDYKGYVDDLLGMTGELSKASDAVEEALYQALVAVANSNVSFGGDGKTIGETVIGDDNTTTVRDMLAAKNQTLEFIWTQMITKGGLESTLKSTFPALVEAYNTWKETDADVAATLTALQGIDATQTVAWAAISTPLYGLMNINHVTLNGMKIDPAELTVSNLMASISGGVNLQMNDGSGVLANFGKLTGNLGSKVTLSENAEYAGESLGGLTINLVTTSEPAAGPLLTQVRSVIFGIGAAKDDSASTTAVDVTYGYILDFLFRTNAANSNLLLQTEGAQRVYSDSTSLATMGAGSTMTFDGTYNNIASLARMMNGIRVVFRSTDGESPEVYGIAKVVLDATPFTMNMIPLTLTAENTAADGETAKYEKVYTDGEAADQTVYLTATETGVGMVNTVLDMGDNTYIFKEEKTDPTTNATYEIWTVKTAKWYETTATTSKYTNGAWVVESTVTERHEATANADGTGGILYFGNQEFSESTGLTTVTNADVYPDYVDAKATTTYSSATAETAPAEGDTKTTVTVTKPSIGADENTFERYYPKYFKVSDQNITLEGDLYLHEYTVGTGETDKGVLTFGDPMTVQTLCALDQNVITDVSALVYLDGDYVDNADVTNSSTGISNSGILNLQFASSATLVPMENTDLKTSAAHSVYIDNNTTAVVKTLNDYAVEGVDYQIAVSTNDCVVSYTVTPENGTASQAKTIEGTELTVTGVTGYVYTIPGSDIKGTVNVTIDPKPTTP